MVDANFAIPVRQWDDAALARDGDDAVSKKQLIAFLQSAASETFLAAHKLHGTPANIAKSRTKAQLVDVYVALFERPSFKGGVDDFDDDDARATTTASVAGATAAAARRLKHVDDDDSGGSGGGGSGSGGGSSSSSSSTTTPVAKPSSHRRIEYVGVRLTDSVADALRERAVFAADDDVLSYLHPAPHMAVRHCADCDQSTLRAFYDRQCARADDERTVHIRTLTVFRHDRKCAVLARLRFANRDYDMLLADVGFAAGHTRVHIKNAMLSPSLGEHGCTKRLTLEPPLELRVECYFVERKPNEMRSGKNYEYVV